VYRSLLSLARGFVLVELSLHIQPNLSATGKFFLEKTLQKPSQSLGLDLKPLLKEAIFDNHEIVLRHLDDDD
jgi:hypothetical protein